MKSNEGVIYLSSDKCFSTIEGECRNMGKPAVFLRVSNCNLTCSGWATPENPNGCDSKIAWLVKNKFTYEQLFQFFEERGFDKLIQRGDILKLTGGEPTLPATEKNLFEWCKIMRDRWNCSPNIEFETNATIVPRYIWNNEFYDVGYVCSPKLANNGDSFSKRYNPAALEWHTNNKDSVFKFVVCSEKDLDEIQNNYISKFNIRANKIWLMPECATTPQFKQKAEWVAEICKKHGYNFSARLQILIYEQALSR